MTLRDGRSITLLEQLGVGSLATVYRGVLESGWRVQRPVALKIFAPAAARDVDREEAMRQLARVARRSVCVRHPAVVQLFEVDQSQGIGGEPLAPFVVTELVDGESLATLTAGWIAEAVRVPVDFAMLVTLRAAEALAASLFSECPDGSLTSLVHGELSPRQILVSNQGEVKVNDFALSSLHETAGDARASLRRLAYAAPELAGGMSPSPESDVFSLGAILHELLVGPRFADGARPGEALEMVRRGEFHASILEPNLPTTIRDVIERATARNPMGRYPHARAMASDLRREMLRLGLCDAQTCVRHAIVGWYESREGAAVPRPRKSGIVSREPEQTDVDLDLDLDLDDEPAPRSGDTEPSFPLALQR